jgi:hypothetical protein
MRIGHTRLSDASLSDTSLRTAVTIDAVDFERYRERGAVGVDRRHPGDGHIRVILGVKRQHRCIVHAVDLLARHQQDILFLDAVEQIEILVQRIGHTGIGRYLVAYRRRHRRDVFAEIGVVDRPSRHECDCAATARCTATAP